MENEEIEKLKKLGFLEDPEQEELKKIKSGIISPDNVDELEKNLPKFEDFHRKPKTALYWYRKFKDLEDKIDLMYGKLSSRIDKLEKK